MERIEKIVERHAQSIEIVNGRLDKLDNKLETVLQKLDNRLIVLDNKLEAYEKAFDKVLRFSTTIIVALGLVIIIQVTPAAIAAFVKASL